MGPEGRALLTQTLFEVAPHGILLLDGDGRLRDVNRAAEQMFGYRRQDLVGQPLALLIPQGLGPANRPGATVVGNGQRKDGSTFPVVVHGSSCESDTGITVVVFITALSEGTAFADRVARISREMIDPLTTVQTRIELMLWEAEGRVLPPEIVEDLKVLHRHVLRVARGVEALQSLVRESQAEGSA
jgi:PAS domain S-box-containing protein